MFKKNTFSSPLFDHIKWMFFLLGIAFLSSPKPANAFQLADPTGTFCSTRKGCPPGYKCDLENRGPEGECSKDPESNLSPWCGGEEKKTCPTGYRCKVQRDSPHGEGICKALKK